MTDEPLRHQAPGGWRRAVVGLLVGLGLGVVVRAMLDQDEAR